MIERIHGKSIDIKKFKKPVLKDIGGHLKKIGNIVKYLNENEESIEQKQCYICGGVDREYVTKIHGFSYVKCLNCDHVYTSRRFSDEAIRRFYEENKYWAEVTYANKETCHYRRDNVALPKVEFVERYLNKRKGRWLDVGSGIGDMVSVAKERGWEATGLELSETSVGFANDVFNVELVRQTLSEYIAANPGLEGTFSAVSLIGVLEHVVDPVALLKDAHTMLDGEGMVLIQVPNANSLASMIQEAFPDNVFRHMSPIEHIMLFTERSLNLLLKNTGFVPTAYWYHGLDIYELITNLVLSNDRVFESRLYHELLGAMNGLQQVIDDRETSDRIIVCAHKLSQ